MNIDDAMGCLTTGENPGVSVIVKPEEDSVIASPCTPQSEKSEEPGIPDWSQDDIERVFPLSSDDGGEEARRETA